MHAEEWKYEKYSLFSVVQLCFCKSSKLACNLTLQFIAYGDFKSKVFQAALVGAVMACTIQSGGVMCQNQGCSKVHNAAWVSPASNTSDSL